MNRFLKGLAIVVLLITVAGAGAVLYAMTMFEPKVVSVTAAATPAVQVQDTFDAVVEQTQLGTFTGRQFADTDGLDAQRCTFLTYTLRLENKGFFPAEWIMMDVQPQQSNISRDILQLGDTQARVLNAGSQGDLTATILCEGDASDMARQLKVTCYVFGQRVEFSVQAQ